MRRVPQISGTLEDTLPKSAPDAYNTGRPAALVHELVKRMSTQGHDSTHSATRQDAVEDTGRSQKTALHLGEELWGLAGIAWQLDEQPLRGVVLQPSLPSTDEGNANRQRPGTTGPPPKARLHPYMTYRKEARKQWFAAQSKSGRAPNKEQWRFLQAVADRLDSEAAEASRVLRGGAGSAPENFAMLAPPGTGKDMLYQFACRIHAECSWLDLGHRVPYSGIPEQDGNARRRQHAASLGRSADRCAKSRRRRQKACENHRSDRYVHKVSGAPSAADR